MLIDQRQPDAASPSAPKTVPGTLSPASNAMYTTRATAASSSGTLATAETTALAVIARAVSPASGE
ncbi:MAG: hypothetical protein V9E93_01140 [Steroidobacteraceae bacterium]